MALNMKLHILVGIHNMVSNKKKKRLFILLLGTGGNIII
jgi:hypothetical protein